MLQISLTIKKDYCFDQKEKVLLVKGKLLSCSYVEDKNDICY